MSDGYFLPELESARFKILEDNLTIKKEEKPVWFLSSGTNSIKLHNLDWYQRNCEQMLNILSSILRKKMCRNEERPVISLVDVKILKKMQNIVSFE